MNNRASLPHLILAVLFSFTAAFLQGQTSTAGLITGVVTDSTGAVIPNATVTVTNTATGFTRVAQTNADGNYDAIPIR